MTNADLNDMTRDELRAEAKRLEIAGRGQMRKPELIAAIKEARRLDAFAEDVFNGIQPETQDQAERRASKGELVPNRAERRAQGQRGRRPVKPAVRGKVMPLHYRGRAIGAKHLNLRVAAGRSNEEFLALTVPSVAQEQPGGAA